MPAESGREEGSNRARAGRRGNVPAGSGTVVAERASPESGRRAALTGGGKGGESGGKSGTNRRGGGKGGESGGRAALTGGEGREERAGRGAAEAPALLVTGKRH